MHTRTKIELDPHTTGVVFKGEDTDTFLSVYSVMYVIANSPKEKGKQLRKWVLEDIFPRDLKDEIIQLQEDHQLAITESEYSIQVIQYENVGLQCEIKARLHKVQIKDLILNR